MEIQRGMRGYHKSRTFHKTNFDFWASALEFDDLWFFDFSTFRILLPLFDFSDFSTFRVLLPLFDFLTFRLFEFFSIVLTLDPECIRVVPQFFWRYIGITPINGLLNGYLLIFHPNKWSCKPLLSVVVSSLFLWSQFHPILITGRFFFPQSHGTCDGVPPWQLAVFDEDKHKIRGSLTLRPLIFFWNAWI